MTRVSPDRGLLWDQSMEFKITSSVCISKFSDSRYLFYAPDCASARQAAPQPLRRMPTWVCLRDPKDGLPAFAPPLEGATGIVTPWGDGQRQPAGMMPTCVENQATLFVKIIDVKDTNGEAYINKTFPVRHCCAEPRDRPEGSWPCTTCKFNAYCPKWHAVNDSDMWRKTKTGWHCPVCCRHLDDYGWFPGHTSKNHTSRDICPFEATWLRGKGSAARAVAQE